MTMTALHSDLAKVIEVLAKRHPTLNLKLLEPQYINGTLHLELRAVENGNPMDCTPLAEQGLLDLPEDRAPFMAYCESFGIPKEAYMVQFTLGDRSYRVKTIRRSNRTYPLIAIQTKGPKVGSTYKFPCNESVKRAIQTALDEKRGKDRDALFRKPTIDLTAAYSAEF